MTYTIGIVGSRFFDQYELMKEKMNTLVDTHGPPTHIVSGGAKGADLLAERWAKENGYHMIVHPADWNKHGRRAGYLRNVKIVEDADRVVAFPSKTGRGTQLTINLAAEKGIPVDIIGWEV